MCIQIVVAGQRNLLEIVPTFRLATAPMMKWNCGKTTEHRDTKHKQRKKATAPLISTKEEKRPENDYNKGDSRTADTKRRQRRSG